MQKNSRSVQLHGFPQLEQSPIIFIKRFTISHSDGPVAACTLNDCECYSTWNFLAIGCISK